MKLCDLVAETVFADMGDRITRMCGYLKRNGFEVLRYKIEDTLLDSKHGDTFI